VRWLADECIDAALVLHLRRSGHDVLYIAEIAPTVNDSEVMAHAQRESRLLLTEDKDFGDLVFRRGGQVPGIVLLRLDPARHTFKRKRLDAAMAHFGEEGLRGRYTTVEEGRFRSRPLRQVR
jgi:predicted nuclease of predicted toxin-antitoxin system